MGKEAKNASSNGNHPGKRSECQVRGLRRQPFYQLEDLFLIDGLGAEAVPEGSLRRALLAPFRPVSINLKAVASFKITKIFPEPLIGGDNAQMSIQDVEIGRHDFEELFIVEFHGSVR